MFAYLRHGLVGWFSSSVWERGGNGMTNVESIAVLGYEKVSEQDSITPLEIFKGAALAVTGQVSPWQREVPPGKLEVKFVSVKPGVVTMQMGTQVVPDTALNDEDLFDILYIPGGVGSGAIATDPQVLEAI